MTASDVGAKPSTPGPEQSAQTPAPEPAAAGGEQPAKPSVQVQQVANLATLHVSGLPSGERCRVSFTTPRGDVKGTVAIVDEDGNLTSYARVLENGKHKVSVAGATGAELASTSFTSPAS